MASLAFGHTTSRPEVPDILGTVADSRHAGECRIFLDHVFLYNTSKRLELERGWNRARLFDKPIQWLMPNRASSSRTWYTWEPQRVPMGQPTHPRPIRNIFSPAMQNETARLVGVGSKPYVRVDDPEATDAADLAKAALLDRNEKTGWDRKNRLGCYHAAMFGQWIHVAKYSISYLNMTTGPVTNAVGCPGCRFKLANAEVPEKDLPRLLSGSSYQRAVERGPSEMTPGETGAFMRGCPECGKELQPITVPRPESEDYADAGQDAIGRQFSQKVPTGDDETEVVSPYCAFPGNQGQGYTSDEDMREIGLRTPRDIEYIRERYENGNLVKPEANTDLFQHHPTVMGHWGLSYRPEGTWLNHGLEDVWIQKPTRRFPRGRLIAMAGRVLLQDSDLYIEGTDIPWLDVRWAQWELQEDEIWGKSLASDLFSVQININSAISQRMDIRHKWTSPKLILHEGQDLQFTGGTNSAYASDVWRVNSRGLPPEVQAKYPYIFGHQGASSSIDSEIQQEMEFVPQASGAFDPEVGNVTGDLNYSALVLLVGQIQKRRQPRVDGIRALKRNIWRMQLRYIARFWEESRAIKLRDDHDKWTVRMLRGQALRDQTDVALEDEPVIDSAVALRASIDQAMTWGTLKSSANGGTPQTDRLINRAINLPEDLNKGNVVQEQFARREWLSWVEDGVEPGVNEAADHHYIHWTTHAMDLLNSKQARILMDVLQKKYQTPWSKVLMAVWTWQKLLNELALAAEALKQAPMILEKSMNLIRSMRTTRDADPLLQQKGSEMAVTGRALEIHAAAQQHTQLVQKFKQLQQRVGPGFPEALEMRIQAVWQRLLIAQNVGVEARPGTDGVTQIPSLVPPLITLVRAWAHALAAYLLWRGMATPQIAPGGPGPGGAPAAPGGAPAEAAPAEEVAA